MMLDRIGLTLLILIIGLASYFVVTRLWLLWKTRDLLVFPGYRPGRPAVLYFTSTDCAPCQTVQRPVLDQLEAAWDGRLQVLEIDATLRPELADAWGVLAVPTTFLTDSGGRPRRVNHGVARLEKLMAQLAEIGEALPESQPVHDLAREEQRR